VAVHPRAAPAAPAPPGGDASIQVAVPRAKAVATPALIPTPLPDDPSNTTIHRLSNGMTVYLSPDPQEPSVVAHIAVRAGSRNDPELSTGLAHYLEHMLFKGTTRLGSLDYAQEKPHLDRIAALYGDLRKPGGDRDKILHEIDAETQQSAAFAIPNELDQLYARLGITGLNAFTEKDATVYIARVPKNRLAQWARVEATRYSDAVFRLFWPELEAVYEEKNRGIDDPRRRVSEAFEKAMFPKHGYGWSSTIGEVEHLKNPAYADMVAFFERYYTPGNMAIVLSGDVDESVLPILENEFAAFRRPAGDAPDPGELPHLHGRTQIDVPVPSREGVILGWPLVSATHPDRVALEVMDSVLLDGSSGIIDRELLQTQKVSDAGSNPTLLREAGYFELYADALAGQRLEDVEAMLQRIVDKLQRGEFTDADLAGAVLAADLQQQRLLESNAGRASLIEAAFINGEDWHDTVGRIDQMRKITKADVVRVANRYLTGDRLVVRKLKRPESSPKITKPAITAVKVDPGRVGAFAREVAEMPVAPIEPVALIAGRDYERAAIATGPLVTVKNQRNTLFAVRYDFEVGRQDDRFVCLALDLQRVSGAGKRSAAEVAAELHALGVVVGTSCTRMESSILLTGPDQNLGPALAIVRDWLAEPGFDETTVHARVAKVLTERANQLTTPQVVFAAAQDYARFGDNTEYLVTPTNQQLQAVAPAQLKTTLAAFLHWQHRTSYFGPRSASDAAAQVVLGDGKRATTPRKPVGHGKPHSVFVTDQQSAQSQIWMLWPRPPATEADRAVGSVFAEYIQPVLFQEVREARGLAYSVTGGYLAGIRKPDASSMFAFVGTQTDKAHDAIDALRDTLHQALDAKRFDNAKVTLTERYRVDRIPPRSVAAAVYSWQDQGASSDPRAARHALADRIDRAALERWMTKVLAGPVVLSITGNHSKLDDARLGTWAPVTMMPIIKLFGY
jgi:predicted Zn-dependent peptidase